MKRTRQTPTTRVDAILTSDWHLRESTPTCRTDNFWEAQWQKVDYVSALQRKYQCVVLHAGDLFHHWKPSPYLLSNTISHLPEAFCTVYGQHDLPNHNLEEHGRCGIDTLWGAGKLDVLPEASWGQTPDKGSTEFAREKRKILVAHVFNYVGKEPWPGCVDPTATKLLRKYPEFDLILTGDNHKPHVVEHEGRVLVNPGSLTRQSADQIDYRPRVYLYNAQTNTTTLHYLPIEKGVVTRTHIERNERRDERIGAFVSKLDGDWSVGMSFEDNLKRFFKTNRVLPSIEELTYKLIEQ